MTEHGGAGLENFGTENQGIILEAIRSRRSVRRFHPVPVPADAVNYLIEAAPLGTDARQPATAAVRDR
jgi:hypothetical protein